MSNENNDNFELGIRYKNQGKHSLALLEFEKAKKIETNKFELYLETADIYRISKDYERALKELDLGAVNGGNSYYFYCERGRIYKEMNKLEEAAAEYEKAVKNGDKRLETNLELARTWRELGKHNKSINLLEEMLDVFSDKGDLYLELGRAYRGTGAYEKAIEALEQAIKIMPDTGEHYTELGRVYLETNKSNLAIKYFLQGIQQGCVEGHVYQELARAYYNEGNVNDSISVLKKMAQKVKDTERIYLQLGRLYREINQHKLSIESFNRVLKDSSHKNDLYIQNKLLNEIEISRKKVKIASFPRKLSVVLTSRCNLKCIMCGVWNKNWDIPRRTVEEIKRLLPFLEHIYWQGGELFYVDYFEELFDRASSYPNLRQTIPTNGLFINKKWAGKLVKSNISLMFSIDGATKKTYEQIRKGAKFENLLKSISILNEHKAKFKQKEQSPNKMFTEINFVVMRSNYHELEKIVEFAKEYEFDAIMINPMRPGSNEEEDCFSKRDKKVIDQIRQMMPRVYKKTKEYGLHLTLCNCGVFEESLVVSEEDHQVVSGDSSSPKTDLNPLICFWPWQQLFINDDGTVKPDPYCSIEIGSVLDSTLDELWNNEIMQNYRKKILDNKYKNWCNEDCIDGASIRWDGLN